MIQDTSFVLDVLGGNQAALNRLTDVEARNLPEKISGVTVLELHEGIQRSSRPGTERRQVLDVLASKVVIDPSLEIMAEAGRISGRLFDAGQPIDREDCVIAASALAEDEPVLTGNPGHFDRVPDLEVVSY